ncbi:MAG: YDG domain-containing protein [Verrucomicrobiia bacterium]
MIYLGSLRPKRQTTSAKFHGSWLGRTTAVKWLNAYVWCQILLAVTLSVEAQPTFSAIGDQSVYEDQPTELIFLPLSDTNVGLGQILLTAASSNPEVVSATNVTFYAYTDDLGHPGLQRFVSVTPVFGQTGSSTITIVANDGTGSATNSFVLTVNPPPLGAARFANTNVITIPSQGMADPYPSQIVVSNLNGTITNLTVTLSQFNHAYPGDVDMLLVAPDNQTAVVIFSRAGDGGVAFTNSPSPAEEAGVTNITFTLSDTAMFALPYPYPFISIPFKPADYSGTNNQTVGQQEGFGILPANGPLADFPSPAPDPSLYTNTPVALSSFNGFSPNGTWSLYVYDYTNYANPNSGSIGAWSLMIAILSPPTISGLTDQSTPVNTPTAAIPFEIEDVQTPASNLVLTATSSDQTVVSTNDIAFGGSDTNRTITLTPEPNTIGTTTISVIVTDSGGRSTTNNFSMTVNPGQLTVTGITASDKPYDGTTNATVDASAAALTGEGLSGSGVTLDTSAVSGAFVDQNAGTNKTVQIAGLALSGTNAGNYILTQPTTTASITPVVLTVTANNDSRSYDGMGYSGGNGVSYMGFVNGETNNVLGGSLVYSGNSQGAVNVGSYTITPGGLTSGNYAISFENGTLIIGATTLTVSANNAVRGYGQTNPVFTVSYSGFVNGDNSGSLGGTLLVGSVAGTNSAVGSYAIVASGLSSTNYAISYTNGVLSVTNGELTVSASNQSKVYGATLVFAGTEFSVSGLVSTDSVSGASLSSLGAGAGAGTGTYGISITNAAGDAGLTNYQITYVPGSLTVGQAGLGVSAGGITANNKVYDGTVAATLSTNNVVLVGLVNGDNVSLVTNNYMANFVSASVGTNISVSVSGLTLTGSAATNYTLAQPTGLMANITPKALTIAPTVPSPVITSILLSNGVVTLQWNSVTGVVYRVQYVNSLNGGGWTDLSPDVTAIGPTATQTNAVGSAPQRFYRIKMLNSGLSANNKVYDGTTAATLTLSNVVLVGVINGDSVSLVTNGYTANFATPNVGTSIPVSVVGLTLSGASAGNYTLTQPTGLAADITGKIITIQSAPPPVITSIGLTNGVVTIMWSSVTGGVYRVQYANSLNGGGWTDLSPDVTATGLTASQTNVVGGVSQRFYRVEVLNSGIAANDKVYDGTTVATISSNNVVLMGVVNDDAVGLSTNGYTANFASPNVGTAIPVTVNGLTLTGASAADYTLAPLSGLTANITPTTLTVSAVNNSRTLGLPNPPFTASYSGFVNGEGPSVLNGAPSLTTGATINSPPGPYDITAEIGTLSATNYVFNFVNGTLTVVALPQLSGVALSGNQLAVTWPTIASQSYQLEYTTNLSAAVWTPVGGSMVGTGSPIVVTNGLGVSPQRFFRLSISP